MKRTLISLLALTLVLGVTGCSKEGSDLSKEDEAKMDKLFTEGIKNPPSADPSTAGKPINAPTDE